MQLIKGIDVHFFGRMMVILWNCVFIGMQDYSNRWERKETNEKNFQKVSGCRVVNIYACISIQKEWSKMTNLYTAYASASS